MASMDDNEALITPGSVQAFTGGSWGLAHRSKKTKRTRTPSQRITDDDFELDDDTIPMDLTDLVRIKHARPVHAADSTAVDIASDEAAGPSPIVQFNETQLKALIEQIKSVLLVVERSTPTPPLPMTMEPDHPKK